MLEKVPEANSVDLNFSSCIGIQCVSWLIHICIYVYLFISFNPSLRLDYKKCKKTENNTWSSLVRTWEDENIELADIIIYTKYPIIFEHLYGFSVGTPQSNVNCGLILHDYYYIEVTLDETLPPMFIEKEWEYLLPQLESNGLLGVFLNVFWRNVLLPPHIIGVMIENCAVYFFSNYYVRVVYKVVNDKPRPSCLICSSMMARV